MIKKAVTVLLVLSVVCTFMVSCGRNDVTDETESMGDLQQNNEGTTMSDGDEVYVSQYTWAEFEALSVEEKDAFIDMFESADAFEEWMNRAKQEQIEQPWGNGGKLVNEYTWAEFEALSVEQKDAFVNMFESAEAFEEWMNRVKQEQIEQPWENGGRPVNEYTWAEFEALSVEQKDAFFDAFESVEAFEKWMEEAKNMNAGEIQ